MYVCMYACMYVCMYVCMCVYNDLYCCRSLRQVDVELMKCLQDRVNLVPVIAKSDTLTLREVKVFKTRVRSVELDSVSALMG